MKMFPGLGYGAYALFTFPFMYFVEGHGECDSYMLSTALKSSIEKNCHDFE